MALEIIQCNHEIVLKGDASCYLDVQEGMNTHITISPDSHIDVYANITQGLNGKLSFTVEPYALLTTHMAYACDEAIDFSIYCDVKEHGEAIVNNACINSSNMKQSIDTHIHHSGAESLSTLNNYAASKGTSVLWMNTNGSIEKGCTHAVCHQKTRGLILDKTAYISSMPLLCIDWFDSSSSHGVAIGELSEAEMFYLCSRGLTEQEARLMLTLGFMNPFIRDIKDEALKSRIEEELTKRILGHE